MCSPFWSGPTPASHTVPTMQRQACEPSMCTIHAGSWHIVSMHQKAFDMNSPPPMPKNIEAQDNQELYALQCVSFWSGAPLLHTPYLQCKGKIAKPQCAQSLRDLSTSCPCTKGTLDMNSPLPMSKNTGAQDTQEIYALQCAPQFGPTPPLFHTPCPQCRCKIVKHQYAQSLRDPGTLCQCTRGRARDMN